MDLDAILTRRPQVALVDELAHTNAPGSRNAKRYQDVQEMLQAGIHVISTLNIQHLESLYDIVEKLHGSQGQGARAGLHPRTGRSDRQRRSYRRRICKIVSAPAKFIPASASRAALNEFLHGRRI